METPFRGIGLSSYSEDEGAPKKGRLAGLQWSASLCFANTPNILTLTNFRSSLPVSGLYKWGYIHKAISKARGHSNYPQVDILLEITLDFAVVLQFNYVIWSVTNDYVFNGGQFPPEMCWRLAQKAIVDIRYKLLFAKSEKLTYGHLDTSSF